MLSSWSNIRDHACSKRRPPPQRKKPTHCRKMKSDEKKTQCRQKTNCFPTLRWIYFGWAKFELLDKGLLRLPTKREARYFSALKSR